MQMRPSNKAALCVVFSRGRDAQPRHESQPVLGWFSSDAPCASAHALPSSVKLLQPCREGMADCLRAQHDSTSPSAAAML
jgi:hypothetical protein